MITTLLRLLSISGLILMFGAVLASHSIEPKSKREVCLAFSIALLGILLFVVGTAGVSRGVQ